MPRAVCGTPEGFRLHKKLEQEPCGACSQAMGQLLTAVRGFRAAVVGAPDVAARARDTTTLQFSAHQRALRAAQRAAEPPRVEPPPAPAMPATACSGDEPWMPRSPKTWLKKFRAAGWWVRLTRAGGPRIDAKGVVAPGKEVVWTIALAAARGDQRLVMLWEFDGEKWGLDDVIHNVRGVIKSTDIKEILDAV